MPEAKVIDLAEWKAKRDARAEESDAWLLALLKEEALREVTMIPAEEFQWVDDDPDGVA